MNIKNVLHPEKFYGNINDIENYNQKCVRFIWTMQKKEFTMLNTLLSATTVVLFGLLCIIYPLGRIRCSKGSREECRKDIDRFLRRIHKKLGIWIIAVSLLHGIAVMIHIGGTL